MTRPALGLSRPPPQDREPGLQASVSAGVSRSESQEPGAALWRRKTSLIAGLALLGIFVHLICRWGVRANPLAAQIPLVATLAFGGTPLVWDLLKKLIRREFGSDLLAGISIVASVFLGEYLAGSIVVLMLSGGEALESFAVASASSVLRALAKRMPSVAHLRRGSQLRDVPLEEIAVGDTVVVLPHDVCPVDGLVLEGHSAMDESYLTGEPFQMTKAPGTAVLSGAVNGESALVIQAAKRPVDSRYAKIMEVMRVSEHKRPKLRRLGDQLGALYTPLAVGLALLAWIFSGDPVRFLAVLVIATPCPLLIAIPVVVIGAISLSARRAIIVKNPAVLEQADHCRTAIFDKTGTLTYGEPELTDQIVTGDLAAKEALSFAASLERYSKHPLARAILHAAERAGAALDEAERVSEPPGEGLRGTVRGREVQITSRKKLAREGVAGAEALPPPAEGLECVLAVDRRCAAVYRFRDAPRAESRSFISHLGAKHQFERVMIVSGDRESEVRYLAEQVGISEIHAEKSPEEKLEIVRRETAHAPTLYVGDGINDALAMMAATVGLAVGQNSDVAAEAAGVVAMENSLRKVDEFMHISRRMRAIALQSAVGGMALSAAGMVIAAGGWLTPVAGAVSQEAIDVLAVLNALRAALPPKVLTDL